MLDHHTSAGGRSTTNPSPRISSPFLQTLSYSLMSLSVLSLVTSVSPRAGDCPPRPRSPLSSRSVCLVSSDFPLHTKQSNSQLSLLPAHGLQTIPGCHSWNPTNPTRQRLDIMASLMCGLPAQAALAQGIPPQSLQLHQPQTQAIFVIPKTCSLMCKWCPFCRAGRIALDPSHMEGSR